MIETIKGSHVVDQTLVVTIMMDLYCVLEVLSVRLLDGPGHVEIYRYQRTELACVDQNNLQGRTLVYQTINFVVHPLPQVSVLCYLMVMENVKELSKVENMLAVILEFVWKENYLPADLEMNVSRSQKCAMESLFVKIFLMWSFVTSTAKMYVQ